LGGVNWRHAVLLVFLLGCLAVALLAPSTDCSHLNTAECERQRAIDAGIID
tara:strand:- start:2348 stop:2500 length:153 start_codon:yes stop_codon:yes gene_type:complete